MSTSFVCEITHIVRICRAVRTAIPERPNKQRGGGRRVPGHHDARADWHSSVGAADCAATWMCHHRVHRQRGSIHCCGTEVRLFVRFMHDGLSLVRHVARVSTRYFLSLLNVDNPRHFRVRWMSHKWTSALTAGFSRCSCSQACGL